MMGVEDLAFAKNVGRITIQLGSEFDEMHAAGTVAPLSGVYLCEGCRCSVVARNGEALPAAFHHRHEDAKPIAWRLLVRSHWA